MQLILDRKEQKALIAIAQLAHDDLNMEILLTDDDENQQLYRLQIIDLALLIEALEGQDSERIKIKLGIDLVYVLGVIAKQHLIIWNDDKTEIIDKAGGGWYSVSSKLESIIKETLTPKSQASKELS
jgi:hypothetical protein